MTDVYVAVVEEDGRATLPREVLAAALAEPGDLIECWAAGPQEIAVKVVFRIPTTGDREPAAVRASTSPGTPATPPIITAFPDGRPVVTIWDMFEARAMWASIGAGAASEDGADGAPTETGDGDDPEREVVGGRSERRAD